jgi:hypothetical protein
LSRRFVFLNLILWDLGFETRMLQITLLVIFLLLKLISLKN